MIERLPESQAGVLRINVSGRLRHEDFVSLHAWIRTVVASGGKCRILFSFGDFQGWDPHALWDDLTFHLGESGAVERIAYVGDKSREHVMVAMSKPFTRSSVRYFGAPDMEAAAAWIRER